MRDNKMSEELSKELINLYNFYKSQKNPPDLMDMIKSYLLEEEGIQVDEKSGQSTTGD